MKIIDRLSEFGASKEVLDQLETRIGSNLPDDYRQFMLEFNGGRPEPSGFVFDIADGESGSSIRYFLTLDHDEDLYTIDEFLDMYDDRIPKKMLPIADDSFGNLVLLDVGAKSAGAVCFWDHEMESEDDPTWDNISVVAWSFTEFINALD